MSYSIDVLVSDHCAKTGLSRSLCDPRSCEECGAARSHRERGEARRAERMKNMFPTVLGSLSFAVFNVHKNEDLAAKSYISKRFGKAAFEREVADKSKSGVMEIFRHPPTLILRRYAWHMALSVKRRWETEAAA